MSAALPSSGTTVMSPGRTAATPTTPPCPDEKSLTKKLSPPSDLRRPFMNPPRVEVDICMSPRVIAMAPASTRTAPPAGKVISPSANEGPDWMSTSMRRTVAARTFTR